MAHRAAIIVGLRAMLMRALHVGIMLAHLPDITLHLAIMVRDLATIPRDRDITGPRLATKREGTSKCLRYGGPSNGSRIAGAMRVSHPYLLRCSIP